MISISPKHMNGRLLSLDSAVKIYINLTLPKKKTFWTKYFHVRQCDVIRAKSIFHFYNLEENKFLIYYNKTIIAFDLGQYMVL